MDLKVIKEIPKELLSCNVKDIHALLEGPTIIHLSGKKEDALFVGALLHGNETTSFYSIQNLLNEYNDKELPRDLILFFGNTLAASKGFRHLPEQPDYNRIWEKGETPEHKVAEQVLDYVSSKKIFASIDIHNNTGKNPFYGCVNYTKKSWIELASLFSKQIVYFTEPSEVLSNAMAQLCPSVTIEAGQPGEVEGIKEVFSYLKTVLNLEGFNENFDEMEAEVYHTIGRIMIDKNASVDFKNELAGENLSFVDNIDENNFSLVKKNTHFGFSKNLESIRAINNDNKDITEDIFIIDEDSSLKSNRMFIPAMFTKDIYIMKEDCMGYIMEKMIPLKL